MKKTVLYRNGKIYTGRHEKDFHSYMLVKDGKVKMVSDHCPPEKCYSEVVDLEGKYVYPCLIDGHVHLLYTIIAAAMGFDICGIQNGRIEPCTLKGVKEKLTAFAASKKPDELVVANNYILSGIEELRFPNRYELDEWCGGRPTIIFGIDGHASSVSTGVLKQLGFDPEKHDGVLTGEDHDRNMGKLTDLIAGKVTPKVLARGLAEVENQCAEFGISHIGALDGNGDSKEDITTKLLIFLAQRMKIRVRLYLQYFDVKRVSKFRKIMKNPRLGGCGCWELDGATGSHSAAHKAPYKDTGEVAPCYYTDEQVESIVQEADASGYQIAAHAIGEKAIDQYVHALMKTGSGRLHRLEHGEFVGEETRKLYSSGKFAIMMQPGYAWIDKRFLHSYEQFLEEEVIRKLALKSFVDAGAIICGSSDSPIQGLNPYQQMQGMVEFYYPEESISMYEAFRSYTENAALAIEEPLIGKLKRGYEANFFLSSVNLFELTADQLPDFRAEATYYRGVLYQKATGSLKEWAQFLSRRPHKI